MQKIIKYDINLNLKNYLIGFLVLIGIILLFSVGSLLLMSYFANKEEQSRTKELNALIDCVQDKDCREYNDWFFEDVCQIYFERK